MNKLLVTAGLFFLIFILFCCQESADTDVKEDFGITNQVILDHIQDGIHTPTGLKAGLGIESVLRHCVSCHSSKLIVQNRATKEGWESMIQWMYETQNLPQLGEQEEIIVAYLAEHYAPVAIGRRASLKVKDWYELEAN